jgi:hypothetical protein
MTPKKEWLNILKEAEQSPLSQKEFCKLHGIEYLAFRHRRNLFLREKKANQLLPEVRRFIPIEIETPKTLSEPKSSKMIEIQLPYGIILRIPAHESA